MYSEDEECFVFHLILYVKKKCGGWTELSSGRKEVETETVMLSVVATHFLSWTYLYKHQTNKKTFIIYLYI